VFQLQGEGNALPLEARHRETCLGVDPGEVQTGEGNVPLPDVQGDGKGEIMTHPDNEPMITPKVERRKGGMSKWAFLTPYWLKINDRLFLVRFIFFFTPYAGCVITWIREADNQREYPHDHSAMFRSWNLLGGYEEDVFSDPEDLSVVRHRKHRWLSCHRMKVTEAHSITKISRAGTVTLLFLGPRRNHSAYWTPAGKQSLGLKIDEEW
jgi:hypothetical protein